MLNRILEYLNSRGYYFYDSNQWIYENYSREYNYYYNNQEPYPAPARRRRKRGSKRNVASNENNQRNQVEVQKRKALEDTNLKKGLETKIQEGNKGYELLVKMGYENGKGLGKNAEGALEPLMLQKKSDRKGLGATETTKTANKNLVSNPITPNKGKKVEPLAIEDKKIVATPKQKAKKTPEVYKKIVVPTAQRSQKSNQVKDAALPNQLAAAEPPTSNTNNNFSAKDPSTPEFISAIQRAFKSEIEVMQLRLLTEASLHPMRTDDDMIIANICIENNRNIADHVFEFIRTELVGWIGVYQQEGMDTPIFHSISNKNSYITIICDNKYAFECVERCVEDILQMKTMNSLKILALPPITPLIYCFDAKYEGIASDTELFLSQLHLHKPKLYSDKWVVASHEVCPEERKTYFIFLIDERSALALNFQYSRSFCVCMQQVTFRNRGIVRGAI